MPLPWRSDHANAISYREREIAEVMRNEMQRASQGLDETSWRVEKCELHNGWHVREDNHGQYLTRHQKV